MKSNILSFIAVSALLAFMASCSNDDIAQSAGNSEETTVGKENTNLTTFVSTDQPDNIGTRTSMSYSTGAFFWEDKDKIYVKDDNGGFQTSSNAVKGTEQAAFKFMMPGKYTKKNYTVYYPGSKTKEDNVVIKNVQTQTQPDDTKHFGESGDCGLGKAERNDNGQFDFKLDHMVSYLCLQPYTSIEFKTTYITEIEVTASTNLNIAGPYKLDADNYKLAGVGNTKTIKLETKGTGAYEHGFPLKKYNPGIGPRAFIIIAPGKHKLTIKYHLYDTSTKVVGVITKTLSLNDYKPNNYYDINSRLDMAEYDAKVYMWDAISHYWEGYESAQPALNNAIADSHYPTSADHNRWYNTILMTGTGTAQATHSAINCPNINEMLWYAYKGDPHWDDVKLWTIFGYLYKGGLWLKKKSAIASDNGGIGLNNMKESFGSKDYRLGTKDMQNEFPKKIDLDDAHRIPPVNKTNYFYLPAIDNYTQGRIRQGEGRGMGLEGQYWTSTCYALPTTTSGEKFFGAFNLTFKRTHIGIHRSEREGGMRCVQFQ